MAVNLREDERIGSCFRSWCETELRIRVFIDGGATYMALLREMQGICQFGT